jgi:hypothetical protein
MNFDGSYIRVGTTDVAALQAQLATLTEEDWNRDDFRQRQYAVHRDTATIPLIFDTDFRHANPTRQPMFERFALLLDPIFRQIAEHFAGRAITLARGQQRLPGYPVRVLLARLRAGGMIPPHIDTRFSLAHAHRLHCPLVTHPEVLFSVDRDPKQMTAGELWEINNRRTHEAMNRGSTDRVHLIIDWVIPGERCCCSSRHHPRGGCSPTACQATDSLPVVCGCYPLSRPAPPRPMRDDLVGRAEAVARQYSAAELRRILASPVVIVSAPRSGSTVLFEALARHAPVWTIGGESHPIFGLVPELQAAKRGFESGRLTAPDARPEVVHRLLAGFLAELRNADGQYYMDLPAERRPATVRLVEKTPRNALNVLFLQQLFSDPRFVFLRRAARDNVASLIEAWEIGLRTGEFATIPKLPGWKLGRWCFLLPPGWKKLNGRPLAEIAAFQWREANQTLMQDLASIPGDRRLCVSYESIVADAPSQIARIAAFAGMSLGDAGALSKPLPLSRSTVSLPAPEKWRRRMEPIDAVAPACEAVERKLASFFG